MSDNPTAPTPPAGVGANWAGNLTYSAGRLLQPTTLEELREHVSGAERIKPVGSRHSFNTIADTHGDMVNLIGMPRIFELDEEARTVTVDAGTRYGDLAAALQSRGWALQNMASLPHITLVGSVATGTHGSGDSNPPLSAAVSSVDLVLADGSMRTFRRAHDEFPGVVVGLGALGVVTQLSLDVVPSFQVRQDVYPGLGWDAVLENFDQLTGAAYSVSLFTRWVGKTFGEAWLKSTEEPATELLGAAALQRDIPMVEGLAGATTAQSGAWGSWHTRLPHFKPDFTPSNGTELQSEYLLPREQAVEGMRRMQKLGAQMEPHLLSSEIRTMAADDQWMSPAFGRDTVGFHFTWRQHIQEVIALLPRIEGQLLPLGARPHWGKLFSTTEVGPLYPRFADFRRLSDRLDPQHRFRNRFLEVVLNS